MYSFFLIQSLFGAHDAPAHQKRRMGRGRDGDGGRGERWAERSTAVDEVAAALPTRAEVRVRVRNLSLLSYRFWSAGLAVATTQRWWWVGRRCCHARWQDNRMGGIGGEGECSTKLGEGGLV